MGISAPEPLTEDHVTTTFGCGKPVLNDWLQKRALKNQVEGASRTYVVRDADGQNVVPVPVDEFRFGVGETYDVIVRPGEDALLASVQLGDAVTTENLPIGSARQNSALDIRAVHRAAQRMDNAIWAGGC